MLKNYFLITLRNIRKYKVYSFINIAGLAIGIAICLIILLFVEHELSYDKFNTKADRIYRIISQSPGGGQTRTPHPMAQALVADFPEVEQAVTMSPLWGPGLTWREMSVRYKDKKFFEKKFFSADTTFFKVFTIKTIKGDADKAIHEPGKVIITESTARKYFGSEDPVGKTITFDDHWNIMVGAVIQDIPQNSHFNFDFLISYVTLKPYEKSNYYTWADFGHYNYIVLKKGVDPKIVEARIPEWSKKYIDYSIPDLKSDVDISKYLKLQALTDIHLKSHLRWELEPNGNINEIYIFASSAILILLIACINFTNISTARSMRRAKEVGVRKSFGAEKKQLVTQFLGESFFLSITATLIAAGLVELCLPVLNSYAGAHLSVSSANILYYITGLFLLTFLVGLITGSYPAFFLSSFKPSAVLSGNIRTGSGAASVRKGLVVFQFSISIFLITSTLVIYSQLNFFRTKDLGFNKDQVIVLPLKDGNLIHNSLTLKNALLQDKYVISAAGATNIPGGQFDQETISWKPDNNQLDVVEMWVDEDFFKTLNIPVIRGRGFSQEFGTDSSRAYILNETAAKKFNWDTPVDKEITWYPQDHAFKGNVIGVVKDFNFSSLHENITPLLILYGKSDFNNIVIKLKKGHIKEGIAAVKNIVNRFSPKYDFEYTFLDEYFAKTFKTDEKMGSLFFIFSLLAIFIACLGLFGLASFMAEQKTKEIGIRKVLGASITNITIMLTKDFSRRVLIANIIAWPAAYYIMNKWLQEFAYHIKFAWWMFVLAGLIAFVIAIITVGWQAVRAAYADPVVSIKYE